METILTVVIVLVVIIGCVVGYLWGHQDYVEKAIGGQLEEIDESQATYLNNYGKRVLEVEDTCKQLCHDFNIERAERKKQESEFQDMQTTIQFMKGNRQ